MERIKRILWGGAAVIALCIFALMMFIWWLGGVRRSTRGAVRADSAAVQERRMTDG